MYKNSGPYGYDEADYSYAASRGILANYTDENALPFSTFIESGTSMGRDNAKRTELSELIRTSDDISFYRHYHGPLFYYWLSVIRGIDSKGYEAAARKLSMVLLGILACVLLWGASKEYNLSFPLALLPMLLLFICQMNMMTAALLTPHAIYAITSLLALILLSRFLRTNKQSDWYAMLGALALAFLSIEYAVLVAATVVACLFIWRKNVFADRKPLLFILTSLGIFLGVIGVLWIGGIVKLTLLKNYIFFTYFTIVRGGEFGSGSFLDVWGARIIESPIVCTVVIATVIYSLVRIRKIGVTHPLLFYPLLVTLTSIRNTSTSPTYVSSIFPPLFLLAAIQLSQLLKNRKAMVASAIVFPIAIDGFFFLKPPKPNYRTDMMIRLTTSFVRERRENDSVILVPRTYLPSLHYYDPDVRFLGYDEQFDNTSTIRYLITTHHPQGLLYIGKNPERYLGVLQEFYRVNADSITTDQTDKSIYFFLRPL
jgi:hypothetical protein